VPQWEVLAADRGGWRAGLMGLRVNKGEVGGCSVRFGNPRTREHNWRAQKTEVIGEKKEVYGGHKTRPECN
jgi:hypothetical protein